MKNSYNYNIIDGLTTCLLGFYIFNLHKHKLQINFMDLLILLMLIRGVYSNVFMRTFRKGGSIFFFIIALCSAGYMNNRMKKPNVNN